MPFITPFERYARDLGLADGKADGFHLSLRAMLKGKFKEEGEALAGAVASKDAAWVEAAIERVAVADTLDEARKALELGP